MYFIKIFLSAIILHAFYVLTYLSFLDSYLSFIEYYFLSLFYEFWYVIIGVLIYDLIRRIPKVSKINGYLFIGVIALGMIILTFTFYGPRFQYDTLVFLGQLTAMGFLMNFLNQNIVKYNKS